MIYVVGFMFSPDLESVVLIRKEKPDWQRGKLNGVGGKVEDGEGSRCAMVREFQEETGLGTLGHDWVRVARINEPGIELDIFTCRHEHYGKVATTTDESVVVLNPFYISRQNVVPNLRWMVPMCQWALRKDHPHKSIDMNGGLR